MPPDNLHAKMETEELQMREEKERPEVFRQVILYVLNKVGNEPNVGEKVLHKLLYFIDFDYYEKFEENLMGETYIRNSCYAVGASRRTGSNWHKVSKACCSAERYKWVLSA